MMMSSADVEQRRREAAVPSDIYYSVVSIFDGLVLNTSVLHCYLGR